MSDLIERESSIMVKPTKMTNITIEYLREMNEDFGIKNISGYLSVKKFINFVEREMIIGRIPKKRLGGQDETVTVCSNSQPS